MDAAILRMPRDSRTFPICSRVRPKKNCYVALSRPTVKCEKTGSGFFVVVVVVVENVRFGRRIC